MPSDELNERRVEIARPPILLAGRADRANRDEYAPGPGQGLGNDPQGYAHADPCCPAAHGGWYGRMTSGTESNVRIVLMLVAWSPRTEPTHAWPAAVISSARTTATTGRFQLGRVASAPASSSPCGSRS
jgi:hypothetical protein